MSNISSECPRCGSALCTDPNSKECDNNLSNKHNKMLDTVYSVRNRKVCPHGYILCSVCDARGVDIVSIFPELDPVKQESDIETTSECPRCGSSLCKDPDSKECSDNCIMRHQTRIHELEHNYYELIYAVGNKYPNETRHETALRYIRSAEAVLVEDGATMEARPDPII